MRRRDFLKLSGTFLATAGLGGISAAGCGSDGNGGTDGGGGDGGDGGTNKPPVGTYAFAEGLASGDPREGSVVLWTRATWAAAGQGQGKTDPVPLLVELSTTDDFKTIALSKMISATPSSDFTVRVIVDGLTPNTIYFYRFTAGSDSIVGRTRTAPKADDTGGINFAWMSCQDYQAGFYGAWRRMIIDDTAAAAADQIAFVVCLGDFIYETQGGGFQVAVDDEFKPIALTGKDGKPRTIDPFPNGGDNKGEKYALTLADYRHLYRQFLRDPDLRAARARWPLISVWDDHEFTDDNWQSQANYDKELTYDEASQKRRVSASQAYFEFMPMNLTAPSDVPGVAAESKDFVDPGVSDAPYGQADITADNQIGEKNNVAAIGAIAIYRSFRFGKHVELVMTDQRSYRSDHAIQEEIAAKNPFFFAPRYALPVNVVNAFDAGKTGNNGQPLDMIEGTPNGRKSSPPGTILGPKQKAWWKSVMQKSDATWKFWGSEVMLLRLLMDTEQGGVLPGDRLADCDAWDGYNTERKELMKFLTDNDIRNVVSVSGDIHAHFAGVIQNDYDDPMSKPAMVEFVAAGISSNTQFSFFESASRPIEFVRKYITFDSTKVGGTHKVERNLNTLLLYGTKAAGVAADTNDLAKIQAAANPAANPHLRYVDTDARGYGIAKVTGAQVTVSLITVPAPITDVGEAGLPVKSKATWTLAPTPQGQRPTLGMPVLEGAKPYPFR